MSILWWCFYKWIYVCSVQNGCLWYKRNTDAECQQRVHTAGTQRVIFGCLLFFLELKTIYSRQPCTWLSSGYYSMRKLISRKLRAAVAGLFSGLSAVSGWVSSKPWKQAASSFSPSTDTLLTRGFKVFIFPCLRVLLTPENVCRVSVVHGISFAEAVDLVTDPLGKIFIYIICISKSARFTWCLRGGDLAVYPASRINAGAGQAKLQKYTSIFSVSLAAQPCVLFEFLVHIWFFVAIRN